MTYAVLLLPFLAVAVALAVLGLRRGRRTWAALALGGAAVLALTLVFDSLMIAADLFRYDDAKLLGIEIGLIPLEDLAYALVAVLAVAGLWRLLPARRDAGRGAGADAGTTAGDGRGRG